jgi:hypothetical protein
MLPQASSCPNLAIIHDSQFSFTDGTMQSTDQRRITQVIDFKVTISLFLIIRVLQIPHYGIFDTVTVTKARN